MSAPTLTDSNCKNGSATYRPPEAGQVYGVAIAREATVDILEQELVEERLAIGCVEPASELYVAFGPWPFLSEPRQGGQEEGDDDGSEEENVRGLMCDLEPFRPGGVKHHLEQI